MFNLFKKDKKKYDYFRTFHTISLEIVKVTNLLADHLKTDSLDFKTEVLSEIQEIQKSVFKQKNELVNALYKDFLPPIDRKDLLELTYRLDRVLKNMANLTVHLDIYQIKRNQSPIKQLTDFLLKIVEELSQLMIDLKDFKHPKKIKKQIEKLNELSIQGVKLYQEMIKDLYLEENDSVRIIKYTNIYESFYEVVQAIEKTTQLVEAVAIENA